MIIDRIWIPAFGRLGSSKHILSRACAKAADAEKFSLVHPGHWFGVVYIYSHAMASLDHLAEFIGFGNNFLRIYPPQLE
jgi:hypothetical protein